MQYKLIRTTEMPNNTGRIVKYDIDGQYTFLFQIDNVPNENPRVCLCAKATKTFLDIQYVHEPEDIYINLSMMPMTFVNADQIDKLIDQLKIAKDAMLTVPKVIADMKSRGFLSFMPENTQ